MKGRSVLHSLENLNSTLFFGLIFIYLVLFSFQGLDFLDEGFIVTFYQQIFKAPETVEYNFMFWFSGVVGGAFNKLFGGMGLWGFRLLGAITTTFTLYASYRLIKKYIDRGYVKAGILITLLMFSNNVKSFHYNSLSSLFYVLTVILLFSGLRNRQYWRIFLAGGCIALDAFTRIPSIVNLGMIIGIAYFGYINSVSFKTQIKQALCFLIGFVVAFVLVIGFMKMIGQFEYFVTAMQHIREMGSGGEGSDYGIFKLLKGFIKNYGKAIIVSGFAISLFFALAWIINKTGRPVVFKYFFPLIVILLTILLISQNIFTHNKLILLYTGTILITGAAIIWRSKDRDLQALTFLAGYTLLAYPLGSSDSLNTVGIYSLWLALPIAVNYLLSLRPGIVNISDKWQFNVGKLFNPGNWTTFRSTILIACVISSLYYAYYYPLFDNHDRIYMRYQPNTDRLKYIYTVKEKADGISNFLNEMKKNVAPNDEILAYPSIAMVHYMTETNPYMHNPAPWLYEAEYFRMQLDTLFMQKKTLPVVVSTPVIKNELTAYHSGTQGTETAWDKRNMNRTLYFEAFLKKHGYAESWSNDLFVIYLPPGKKAY